MLQPAAIHVHEHYVSSYDDWPSPVREFCHAALARDPAECPSASTRESLAILSQGLSILQRVDQPWETVRKTSLTMPFVLDSMCAKSQDESVEWRYHANPIFIMPIDPCCFNDPNARFQPPYCIANAIFTSAVYMNPSRAAEDVYEDEELGGPDEEANSATEDEVYTPVFSDQMDVSVHSSDDSSLMHVDNQPADDPNPKDAYYSPNMDTQEDCAVADELEHSGFGAGSYESSEPDWEEEPTHQDHAQLIFGQAVDVLEAAVACVASSADAYTVLASGLLQRYSLGLRGPLTVVVVDKYETTVLLVFGWVQLTTDDCVEVHAAHARSAAGQVSNPTAGLFNLSHMSDTARLHEVLKAIIELGHRDIDGALAGIASEGVRKVDIRWRLDLAGTVDLEDETDSEHGASERVRRWLIALAPSSKSASSNHPTELSCDATSFRLMSHPPKSTAQGSKPSIRGTKARSKNSATDSATTTQSARSTGVTPAQWTEYIQRLRLSNRLALKYINPKCLTTRLSASEYAKLHRTEPWLSDLSPCEVMELGRLAIPAPFPQTAYDVRCFPCVKPYAAVAAYFDPVKLPNKRLAFIDSESMLRRYQEHCDKHDHSRALMESRYHAAGGGLDRAAANITQTQATTIEAMFGLCFDRATRLSDSASALDWNATGETEGRSIGGWDAVQALCLGAEGGVLGLDAELSIRFEKQIQIAQHDAYLRGVENSDHVLSVQGQANSDKAFPDFYAACVKRIPLEVTDGEAIPTLPPQIQGSGLSQTEISRFVAAQHEAAKQVAAFFEEWRMQFRHWAAVGFASMLCRIREEPSKAKCDVVAAVRIRNVFEEKDVSRVNRFNALCEGQEPQRQQSHARLDMARALSHATSSVEQNVGPCRSTSRPGLVQLARAMAESADSEDDGASSDGDAVVEGAPEGKRTRVGGGALEGGDARLTESTLGRWDRAQVGEDAPGDQERILNSSTRARAGSESRRSPPSLSLTLGVYFAENKVEGIDFGQCTYQGVMDMISSIKHLSTVGIREFPVFCSVIDGRTAHVLCGWSAAEDKKTDLPVRKGLAKPVVVYMSYLDAPTYDLTDPMETLRFCGFLLHIRYVHAPRLLREFEKVRKDFMTRWQDESDDLNWTLDEQRKVIHNHLEELEAQVQKALSEIRATASTQASSSKASKTSSSRASKTPSLNVPVQGAPGK